ncbi:MAG TPA: HAMP domain-containing sensor histidine kinase [Paludibacteraceae bacterium]|nr:HAMP domain-containing sensor histidine kinase [Paludibacteraceae bacterium]
MKRNVLILFSGVAIVLLIVSQIIWIQQLMAREKQRLEMELKQTLQSIVAFCLSREVGNKTTQMLSLELIPIDPDKIPKNAVVKGSFDTKEYSSDKNLGNYLVGVFAEDLLQENKIPLEPIDSLFRKEFAFYPEISEYSMSIEKNDSILRKLYVGENTCSVLKDANSGVNIRIPIGKTGKYWYHAQVIFKPTIFTQRLQLMTALSAIAVIVISVLLLYQLALLRQQTRELAIHKHVAMGIVHDLKSPLAYVYTLLGFFEKSENEVQKKGMFYSAKVRVKYLSEKIEILLSVMKSKEHFFQIHCKPYDFNLRCKEIMEELCVIYKGKDIAWCLEPAEGTILSVDPVYFDGCVRNLLDNAVKYSGDKPFIKILTIDHNKHIFLSFADNGKGILKKERKKIFREFYRHDKSSSVKNHGIGLAFTRQVVRAHSGKIFVDSKEGEGSIFTIVFPKKIAEKYGTNKSNIG